MNNKGTYNIQNENSKFKLNRGFEYSQIIIKNNLYFQKNELTY